MVFMLELPEWTKNPYLVIYLIIYLYQYGLSDINFKLCMTVQCNAIYLVTQIVPALIFGSSFN